jgi:carbamoyltransferase
MNILGISPGHDTAACLLVDGEIVADAAEERFSRVKHDSHFPTGAITFCLQAGGIASTDINLIAIAGRFLPVGHERFFRLTPEQAGSLAAMRPIEVKARNLLMKAGPDRLPLDTPRFPLRPDCRFIAVDHHRAHAAAAYFSQASREAWLVLTLDGIGDDVAVGVWRAVGNSIEPLMQWGRDASLGWFYGNVTEALGWQHGDGEGTTMGLAPYGDAAIVGDRLDRFAPELVDGDLTRPHEFGVASFFNDHGNFHWNFPEAADIRRVVGDCGAANVAARAQQLVEERVLGLARHFSDQYGMKRLACGGGLFLNVKLNQRLREDADLDQVWVFPNPGDAGLALGAALAAWHDQTQPEHNLQLTHLSFGPAFEDDEIRELLDARGLAYRETADPAKTAAEHLAANQIVGWFQGRMESGPRALGNRCILMSANQAANKDVLNARVKFRQAFRPFCPAVLFERKDEYVVGADDEPFMITAFPATLEARRRIPAVVHVDSTVRPQTVRQETQPLFHRLISTFAEITGEAVVLSTSFNVRGEPIVCTPRDALRCFFDTGLDTLVIGPFVLEKPVRPSRPSTG